MNNGEILMTIGGGFPVPQPEGRTCPAKLVFKRGELIYDAQSVAFIRSDSMPEQDQPVRHYVGGLADEGNIDRVTRILTLAYAEAVELLMPYTKKEVGEGQESLDDTLKSPEEYVISLSLPEGFSQTTLHLIKDYIHEYMVCRVLTDWLALTLPEESAYWEERRKEYSDLIRKASNSRTRPILRRCKPF